jgi:hypothetical protein
VGHGVVSQRAVEDGNRLAKPLAAPGAVEEVDAERGVLHRVEAAAEHGFHTAVGELVDGQDRLRQHARVAHGDVRDHRFDPHPLGLPRHSCQRCLRLEQGNLGQAVDPELVDHPRVVEADRLGEDSAQSSRRSGKGTIWRIVAPKRTGMARSYDERLVAVQALETTLVRRRARVGAVGAPTRDRRRPVAGVGGAGSRRSRG